MRNKIDSTTFLVKVHTNQRHNRYLDTSIEKITISLKAPPKNEEANNALITFLSRTLRIPSHTISIALGKHHTTKLITIEHFSDHDLIETLTNI